jgi:hypothetical protein
MLLVVVQHVPDSYGSVPARAAYKACRLLSRRSFRAFYAPSGLTTKNTIRTRWFCQTALLSLTVSLCTELICLLSMKAKVSY